MKTLTAHEAIAEAERSDVLLFSRDFSRQVTAAQARQLIELNQRDPEMFVLENWPDSDREAEEFVLRCFHTAMIRDRKTAAAVPDVCLSESNQPSIHPAAAERAAERLEEQKLLEVVDENNPEVIYRLPRNVRFTGPFLTTLRARVCPECAHLDLDKPFHRTCLNALIDYLIHADFKLADVTVLDDPQEPSKAPSFVQKVNSRWLSQTVSATRGKLRSVVGPILARESAAESTAEPERPSEPAAEAAAQTGPFVTVNPETIEAKKRISKGELIAYLNSVQIIDEDSELEKFKAECAKLRNQLEEKDYDLLKLEREKAFLKQQCDEIQRDMDTLLDAMQIAKRRGHVPAQVIDADIRD